MTTKEEKPGEVERWADNCARAVCLLFPHIPGLDPDLSHSNVAAVIRVHAESALAASKARDKETRDHIAAERDAAQAEIARQRSENERLDREHGAFCWFEAFYRESRDGSPNKLYSELDRLMKRLDGIRSALGEKESGDAGAKV